MAEPYEQAVPTAHMQPILRTRKGFFLFGRVEVPLGHTGIIVRNERVERVVPSGAYWILSIPLFLKRDVRIVDTRERSELLQFRNGFFSRDEQLVEVELAIAYRVADPERFAVGMLNGRTTLHFRLKAMIGELLRNLESVEVFLAGQSRLQRSVAYSLGEICRQLGFELRSCDITEVNLPTDVRNAYSAAIETSQEAKAQVQRIRRLIESGAIDAHLKEKFISSMAETGLVPASTLLFYGQQFGYPIEPALLTSARNSGDESQDLLEKTSTHRIGSIGRLRVKNGPGEGHVHRLSGLVNNIGRSPDNEVVLPADDKGASRNHAQIRRGGDGQTWIRNASQANLILVNDNELPPGQQCELKLGDELRLGSTVYVFEE